MEKIDDRLHHVWRPYTQMQTEAPPLKAVRTEGAEIFLDDGRRLIDGIASWWTACHGYNHGHITNAIKLQLEKMPHIMFGGLTHEPALDLGQRLANLLPGVGTDSALKHVFFSDSGSVAVEIALKMAAQYWRNNGQPERIKFVCFRHAYHGDTMGAMSVCDPEEGMHAHFRGFFPEQKLTVLPKTQDEVSEFSKFLQKERKNVAAVILEPLVQAAGGMKFHEPGILHSIKAACKANDVLFIADEIATGFGRTGTMFACEQAEIAPDIICLGKAMTGGSISMAATAANDQIWQAFQSNHISDAFMHGPTYMANPLGCAAANASLDLFRTGDWRSQTRKIEDHFRQSLEVCKSLPGVVDVRSKGAIGVVEVSDGSRLSELKKYFVSEGVWVRPFGDIIYLMPPFILTNRQLSYLTDTVSKITRFWSKL